MKKKVSIAIALLAVLAVTSCNSVKDDPQVKNVIYLIGDGMGFGAVTSLLLTADHETGGTWLNYTGYEVGGSSPVVMSYSTRGHSGVVVPIFAYGEGAEAFAGVMKNTDIPKKIEQLMK